MFVRITVTDLSSRTQQDIQCIEKIQKRAARCIINDYWTRSQAFMTKTLQDIGLKPLQEGAFSTGYHSFAKSHLSLKTAWYRRIVSAGSNQLSISSDKRSRNNSKCFINIDSVCTQYKNSFFPRTIVEWNALDNSIVCEPDINSFKTKLKTHVFD